MQRFMTSRVVSAQDIPLFISFHDVSEALAGSQEFFLERLGYGAEESAGVNSATWLGQSGTKLKRKMISFCREMFVEIS